VAGRPTRNTTQRTAASPVAMFRVHLFTSSSFAFLGALARKNTESAETAPPVFGSIPRPLATHPDITKQQGPKLKSK
jgi:hypothetical protein